MKKRFVFLLNLTISLGTIVGALFWYQNTNSFIKQAVKAEGIVIDFVSDRRSSKPVIRFKDAQDNTIEFTSSVGTNPPRYNIGQPVSVLYLPQEPKNAAIDDFLSLWSGQLVMGTFGILFAISLLFLR